MLKANHQKHILNFKKPGGTSRGILTTKETWFLHLKDDENWGIGECALFRGLSIDDRPEYEDKLHWLCENIHLGKQILCHELSEYPSIQFGIETAFKSLKADNSFDIFPSDFTNGKAGIVINGLIWMGDRAFMKEQFINKIDEGFSCIKMKIGAIDFQEELELLRYLRSNFRTSDLELRVDANGAFSASEALEKLKRLSEYELHSIEQPIQQGQWEEMADLCRETPLPIALDEELLGVFSEEKKMKLLDTIEPQYLILKPSLIGGFQGSDLWISHAEKRNIGWWMTSALESNIGLNAISQYTFTKSSKLPQGLGTGGLFQNNIPSPLEVCNGRLHYNTNSQWNLKMLQAL